MQVHGLYQNSGYYQLVMQRVPGNTLYHLIETNTIIEEAIARILYTQVCIGSRESLVSLEDSSGIYLVSGIYRLLNICRI